MTKPNRYHKGAISPEQPAGKAISILLGFIVSACISLLFIALLALINAISDTFYLEEYLQYLLVTINMLSIFIGSIYTAQRVKSKILISAMAVGFLYVMFSIGIGISLGDDAISIPLLFAKISTGLAAGALGGLVGLKLT